MPFPEEKKTAQEPADADDEPFLIDPGNEDPGAGIDQVPPEPASENDGSGPTP